MGVNFAPLIREDTLTLKDLKERRVAIDGMNMLYQILYNPFQMQKKLPDVFYRDSTQQVITHLYGWLQKIINFYKAKIFPIIIFDGKHHELKYPVQVDRARNFLHLQSLYEQALKHHNKQHAKTIALNKQYMFTKCLQESKILLEAAGIPVIMAPGEAEAQCVVLQKKGTVDFVVSEDYDVLLFGATRIIRRITFQTRQKINNRWRTITPPLKYINLEKNLKELHLTRDQLIDLSILIGNDFFQGIPNIGPKIAFRAIKKFGNLENMKVAHIELFKDLTQAKIDTLRKIFKNPLVIEEKKAFKLKPFNRLRLEKLFLKEHTLNEARITRRLNQLEKQYLKMAKLTKLNPAKLEITEPAEFDIHLQRRLDRGKKKLDQKYELSFSSAVYLNQKSRSQNEKKQKNLPQKMKKLNLKDYFKQ